MPKLWEDKTMKKIVNIIVAVLHITIMCLLAPIYLLIQPVVTAHQWGGIWKRYRYALPFEVRCVWHTLRDDWRMDCQAIVFEL